MQSRTFMFPQLVVKVNGYVWVEEILWKHLRTLRPKPILSNPHVEKSVIKSKIWVLSITKVIKARKGRGYYRLEIGLSNFCCQITLLKMWLSLLWWFASCRNTQKILVEFYERYPDNPGQPCLHIEIRLTDAIVAFASFVA